MRTFEQTTEQYDVLRARKSRSEELIHPDAGDLIEVVPR